MSVVVIGGGVVGASAAYRLARDGVEVTLVDAAFDGRATSAGADIISPWSSRATDPDRYRIAAAGAEYYAELRQQLEDDGQADFGYRQVGALELTTDDEVDDLLVTVRQRAAASQIAGDVEVLDGVSAETLHPLLRHDGPVIHIPGGARLDGRRLRDALWSAAALRGARIITGRAAIRAGDRIDGVEVEGETVGADTVIDASGAWSPRLLEPLGLHVSVAPQRGQIVHLGLPGADPSGWPMLLPPSDHYLLSFEDRVVVGATRETGSGFDHRLTAAGLQAVLAEALRVAPGLAEATVLEARIGFRPLAPDDKPLLGTAPELPGLIVANGLGATGLTMGPYVGSVAAALAAGRDPGIDLAPYDPFR